MDKKLKEKLLSMSEEHFEKYIGFTEEKWRFIKAQLSNRELAAPAIVNSSAPLFCVKSLVSNTGKAGGEITIDQYLGRTLALIFGSYTCPIFRSHTKRINEVYRELRKEIAFLCIYVYEMHPLDGWMIPVNLKDDVIFNQPTTLAQRAAIANIWRTKQSISMDIALDDMNNTTDSLYAGSPERLYVINGNGIITYRSPEGPFDDSFVEEWYRYIKQELK
ncbi:deiodinase-like protein [Spartinivicinus poritis]|uniref:Iodothyronine deiodinase n=1 Tax=Spartinivicinus poritis TaxID=2994640 RepID=A0ABT5UH21_9GAMM|nr:deiodinase-like protein [Spartinivicinus sp. A2-2]MDE1465665.1 hypothetical protein [Spartinivicinus sp. A2-2]